MPAPRSSLQVTFDVWKALFLREAVTRLSAKRASWLWLLVDPVAQVVFAMLIFGFLLHRVISGADTAMFILTGRIAFSIMRNSAIHSMDAVAYNQGLFSYRQVHPVDTVIVRAVLEGFLMLTAGIVLLFIARLFDYEVIPDNPLRVFAAIALLWLLGLGVGLIASVAADLVPEIGKLIRLAFMPLYLLSAVIHPAAAIPHPQRGWLMYNPIVHGVDALHAAYFGQFRAAPETDLTYLASWVLGTLFLGFALHLRFSTRLASR